MKIIQIAVSDFNVYGLSDEGIVYRLENKYWTTISRKLDADLTPTNSSEQLKGEK